MKELELSYYFKEINEFRFKDVFKDCKYPWEALANINMEIIQQNYMNGILNGLRNIKNIILMKHHHLLE